MILVSFGTRPEWLKIKPLLDKFKDIPYKLVCTNQHTDLIDSSIKKYKIDYMTIKDGNNRLDDIVKSVMDHGDWIFNDIKYTMVQGDTTSAFAIALGSFHRKIPVIHLEAGLRSWNINNPYPEEFNRISISNMSSIHFCPTKDNKYNLKLEDHTGKVYVVGNTILDNLKNIVPTIDNTVLVTLHRRENIDIIDQWFIAIENIAIKNPNLNFIFPMHPNPEIQKHRSILKSVNILKPLCYEKCIKILSKCGLVITDSGGLQEESSFLKKKCIVCRQNTERPEGECIFSTLCPYPYLLEEIFNHTKIELVDHPCPYGDGNSSERVIEILRELL